MTDMREALKPVLSFLDELAANAAPHRRKTLNPITIGGSAACTPKDYVPHSHQRREPVAWGEFYGGVCNAFGSTRAFTAPSRFIVAPLPARWTWSRLSGSRSCLKQSETMAA